jgi:hypothetical protein
MFWSGWGDDMRITTGAESPPVFLTREPGVQVTPVGFRGKSWLRRARIKTTRPFTADGADGADKAIREMSVVRGCVLDWIERQTLIRTEKTVWCARRTSFPSEDARSHDSWFDK